MSSSKLRPELLYNDIHLLAIAIRQQNLSKFKKVLSSLDKSDLLTCGARKFSWRAGKNSHEFTANTHLIEAVIRRTQIRPEVKHDVLFEMFELLLQEQDRRQLKFPELSSDAFNQLLALSNDYTQALQTYFPGTIISRLTQDPSTLSRTLSYSSNSVTPFEYLARLHNALKTEEATTLPLEAKEQFKELSATLDSQRSTSEMNQTSLMHALFLFPTFREAFNDVLTSTESSVADQILKNGVRIAVDLGGKMTDDGFQYLVSALRLRKPMCSAESFKELQAELEKLLRAFIANHRTKEPIFTDFLALAELPESSEVYSSLKFSEMSENEMLSLDAIQSTKLAMECVRENNLELLSKLLSRNASPHLKLTLTPEEKAAYKESTNIFEHILNTLTVDKLKVLLDSSDSLRLSQKNSPLTFILDRLASTVDYSSRHSARLSEMYRKDNEKYSDCLRLVLEKLTPPRTREELEIFLEKNGKGLVSAVYAMAPELRNEFFSFLKLDGPPIIDTFWKLSDDLYSSRGYGVSSDLENPEVRDIHRQLFTILLPLSSVPAELEDLLIETLLAFKMAPDYLRALYDTNERSLSSNALRGFSQKALLQLFSAAPEMLSEPVSVHSTDYFEYPSELLISRNQRRDHLEFSEVLEFLKSNNCNLNLVSTSGNTLLHLAAASFSPDEFDLLEKNVIYTRDSKSSSGVTCTRTAVNSENFDLVQHFRKSQKADEVDQDILSQMRSSKCLAFNSLVESLPYSNSEVDHYLLGDTYSTKSSFQAPYSHALCSYLAYHSAEITKSEKYLESLRNLFSKDTALFFSRFSSESLEKVVDLPDFFEYVTEAILVHRIEFDDVTEDLVQSLSDPEASSKFIGNTLEPLHSFITKILRLPIDVPKLSSSLLEKFDLCRDSFNSITKRFDSEALPESILAKLHEALNDAQKDVEYAAEKEISLQYASELRKLPSSKPKSKAVRL